MRTWSRDWGCGERARQCLFGILTDRGGFDVGRCGHDILPTLGSGSSPPSTHVLQQEKIVKIGVWVGEGEGSSSGGCGARSLTSAHALHMRWSEGSRLGSREGLSLGGCGREEGHSWRQTGAANPVAEAAVGEVGPPKADNPHPAPIPTPEALGLRRRSAPASMQAAMPRLVRALGPATAIR